MATFIDTNVLVAAVIEDDTTHKKAMQMLENITDPVFSDYVFDEMTNILMRRATKQIAISVAEDYLSAGFSITRITPQVFEAAWVIFCVHKPLSFTDATNIAVMKSLGITHIATFDEAFKSIPGVKVIS